MASSKIKIIDYTIDHDKLEEGSIAVAKQIMPSWNDQDVKYKVLHGGYGNKTGCCYLSSDVNLDKALVVRTYGVLSGTRDKEICGMQMISAVECCKPMYGLFNNGHVYGFAQGGTLPYKELSNPDTIRKLSTMIAKVHNIDTDVANIFDRTGTPTAFPKNTKNLIRSAAIDFLSLVPETYDEPESQRMFDEVYHSQERLKKELQEMVDYLDSLELPKTLIHGDFQPRNIVYNEETGELNLLDFELTSHDLRCTDLSRLFGMKGAFTLIGIASESESDLSEETVKLWMKYYLEASYDIKGKDKSLITKDDIDELYTEHYIFGIVDKLFLSVFMMQQIPSGAINFNILRMTEPLMKYYNEEKKNLSGLKQKLEAYRQKSNSKA